jgi:predicted ATP pyrophosphatase (TIGR00289 family)
MKTPQLIEEIPSTDAKAEFKKLDKLIALAKENHSIEGIVHGGILSKYQKDNFSLICKKNNLELISPLWNKEPESYMKELLEENFEYIISSVSCDGLNDYWLGQIIDKNRLEDLKKLQKQFRFNLNFEGGEAETFVINCPLFEKPLFIQDSSTEWDGYRGRFEILEMKLKDNA